MAAASLLERSGASFSGEPFAIGSGFSLVGVFSIAGPFSVDELFSLEDFAVVAAFSVAAAFALVELFAVAAFAFVDDFSVDEDFGFVETVPFVPELAFVDAGVFAGVVAFVEGVPVRALSVEPDAVAESAFGAVSGRTPRAQALALAMMTIAISGMRARPVISSLVEGYGKRRRSGPAYLTPRAHRRYHMFLG